MAYTKITKPTTTYSRDGLPKDRLILQDDSVALFQDGAEIVLNLIARNYTKQTKPTTTYSLIAKPSV